MKFISLAITSVLVCLGSLSEASTLSIPDFKIRVVNRQGEPLDHLDFSAGVTLKAARILGGIAERIDYQYGGSSGLKHFTTDANGEIAINAYEFSSETLTQYKYRIPLGALSFKVTPDFNNYHFDIKGTMATDAKTKAILRNETPKISAYYKIDSENMSCDTPLVTNGVLTITEHNLDQLRSVITCVVGLNPAESRLYIELPTHFYDTVINKRAYINGTEVHYDGNRKAEEPTEMNLPSGNILPNADFILQLSFDVSDPSIGGSGGHVQMTFNIKEMSEVLPVPHCKDNDPWHCPVALFFRWAPPLHSYHY